MLDAYISITGYNTLFSSVLFLNTVTAYLMKKLVTRGRFS